MPAPARAGFARIGSPGALDGDYAPRPAAKILSQDAAIAVAVARRLGVDASFARLAEAAFADALAAGYGDAGDAILVERALAKIRR